jgi:DNA repair protein RecN (Recombination protein N)
LGRALADLHGQHEQQNLLQEDTHLGYLDAVGETEEPAARTGAAYRRAAAARETRDAFLASLRRSAEERDFLRFQLEELVAADLREGEEEALLAERHLAAHAGRLAETAGGALLALTEADPGAVELLGKASRLLGQAAALDASLDPALRQIDEALVAAEDLARELRAYTEGLGADPERLDAIEARLDLLAKLKRKYHCGVSDLLGKRDGLASLMASIEEAPGRLAELEGEVEGADAELRAAAAELSAVRSRAAAGFARSVTRELQGLGMSGARFRVELLPPRHGLVLSGCTHPVNARGAEEAVFVLAANPGEKEGPLTRIASGGEISRVMLALKNVLRRADPVPVAIFDEVDAGIGGLVAEAVAGRLAAIAQKRQVIVVTHLAVIAGKADHHLRLVKSTRNQRTAIAVESLDGVAREEELARMLAGSVGGEAARETARALMNGEAR